MMLPQPLFFEIESSEEYGDKLQPVETKHLSMLKVPSLSASEVDHCIFTTKYRCRFPLIIKGGCKNWSFTTDSAHGVDNLIKQAGAAALKEIEVLISNDNRQFLKHELTTCKTMTISDAFRKILNETEPDEENDSLHGDDSKMYARVYLDAVPQWINCIDLCQLDSLFGTGHKLDERKESDSKAGDKLETVWSNFKLENIGIWSSSAGCETPLHFDLCHGFLCQVQGRKNFVLAPPEDTNSLSWSPNNSTKNSLTSNVDLSEWIKGNKEQREKFRYIDECAWRIAELESGDILYTPPGWWHHVTSRTRSLSVLVPTDPDQRIDDLPPNVHSCV